MEELLMDNILSTEEIDNLFSNEESEQETSEKETPETEKNTEETTEELNVDTLFTDVPESVGSGKEDINEGKEDTNSTKEIGASPKNNFYSSIARALRDEGIFPDLDNNVIDGIKQPEDFAEMVEQTIQSKFDERQKRIDDALNYGVEISDIQRYENTLKYLNSIKDDTLSAETGVLNNSNSSSLRLTKPGNTTPPPWQYSFILFLNCSAEPAISAKAPPPQL